MPKPLTPKKNKVAPARVIPLKSERAQSIIESVLSTIPIASDMPRDRSVDRGALTAAQRVIAVMGRRSMKARELADAMVEAGEPRSNDINAKMANILASTRISLKGPDGQPLRRKNGYMVRVHMFKVIQRGLYRVATPEDQQEEAQMLLAADVRETAAGKRAQKNGVPSRGGSVDPQLTAVVRKLAYQWGAQMIRAALDQLDRELV